MLLFIALVPEIILEAIQDRQIILAPEQVQFHGKTKTGFLSKTRLVYLNSCCVYFFTIKNSLRLFEACCSSVQASLQSALGSVSPIPFPEILSLEIPLEIIY